MYIAINNDPQGTEEEGRTVWVVSTDTGLLFFFSTRSVGHRTKRCIRTIRTIRSSPTILKIRNLWATLLAQSCQVRKIKPSHSCGNCQLLQAGNCTLWGLGRSYGCQSGGQGRGPGGVKGGVAVGGFTRIVWPWLDISSICPLLRVAPSLSFP